MDIGAMNRKDFSIEVKIVRPTSEKTFDVPLLSDNLVWHQLLIAKGTNQQVVLTASNRTIAN
jgi:hypothetical protein